MPANNEPPAAIAPRPNGSRVTAYGVVSWQRMKLTSYRDKDRTHLRDLIEVGLVDASRCARLPSDLSPRLQNLLNSPEG